jgi:hydrogenase expression/formation protein HypC
MRLLSRDGDEGRAELDGVACPVRLDLVPEARVGDAVIVHAGFAIQVLDAEAAAETLALIRAMRDGP